jgi:hypothetical protein
MIRVQSARRRGACLTGLLALLVCSACVSQQTVVVWEKEGAREGELEEARAACLREPEVAEVDVNQDRIQAELRGNAFVACMEKRGWTWKTEAAPAD